MTPTMDDLAPNLTFRPGSGAFRADPYPVYRDLLARGPVRWRDETGPWLLSRYEDVCEALASRSLGRRGDEILRQEAEPMPAQPVAAVRARSQLTIARWAIMRNPPTHTRLRRMMQPSMAAGELKRLDRVAAAATARILADVGEDGSVDVVGDVAFPVALRVTCEVLGIPEEADDPRFRSWSEALSGLLEMGATEAMTARGEIMLCSVSDHLRRTVARSGAAERSVLVADLSAAAKAGEISEDEFVANLAMMFLGTHSTTVALIATTILLLLRHPEQLAQTRADPGRVEAAIVEAGRFESPVQVVTRLVLADTVIGGARLTAGETVHCLLGAANRDPARFAEADRFDLHRTVQTKITFGIGVHACLGRKLAPLVTRAVVAGLLARGPFHADSLDPPDWDVGYSLRSLKSLQITYGW